MKRIVPRKNTATVPASKNTPTDATVARPARVRKAIVGDTKEVRIVADALRDLEIVYRDIDDLIDYEFNPRDNNEAVQYVANSIRQFGFINPIIVDKDDIIIVGHTRKAGAKLIGYTRAPTIKMEHLTEEQVKAFRIIDNKVGEIAKWNYELLAKEIGEIGSSMDLIELGFSAQQVDCLSAMVADDCLSSANELMKGSSLDSMAPAPKAQQSNAPATTRWVLGELVLNMPAEVHRAWITALREECDFDQKTMANMIYSKLGVDHVAD